MIYGMKKIMVKIEYREPMDKPRSSSMPAMRAFHSSVRALSRGVETYIWKINTVNECKRIDDRKSR